LSRKNDRITVVTTEPNRLVVGALVGNRTKRTVCSRRVYNVAASGQPYAVRVVDNSDGHAGAGMDVGDTVSSSGGGTVSVLPGELPQVVGGHWGMEYYVCGQRPGESSLKLIGVTKPTGLLNGYTDVAFEDYGSPYMTVRCFLRM